MYAKIIKILNVLLIFIFFIVNSSCSKSKPEEKSYFIIRCKTSGQYDINEDGVIDIGDLTILLSSEVYGKI